MQATPRTERSSRHLATARGLPWACPARALLELTGQRRPERRKGPAAHLRRALRRASARGCLLGSATIIFSLGDAASALACPDCSVGQVARAQFWSDDFLAHLLSALVPFVLMIIAAVCAERFGRPRSTETRLPHE